MFAEVQRARLRAFKHHLVDYADIVRNFVERDPAWREVE
jgi:hypothetical protein